MAFANEYAKIIIKYCIRMTITIILFAKGHLILKRQQI